ncbi:hypothetical protein V6237_17050 [Pseudoalteromonas carrageenovora]|uniref:hypothetical protein n=1 Tax=Pseudoalteromonas TaxID=53246 RepID=UPI00311F489B
MSAYNVNVDYLSTPISNNVDELLYGSANLTKDEQNWQSWDECIFQCVLKAKELFAKVEDLNTPLVWLLPALTYQDDLKQLLAKSFTQLFPDHVEHLYFYGAVAANKLMPLAKHKKWQKVNVIAIDAIFKAHNNCEYKYLGVGGALATLKSVNTGWMQLSHELSPSVDFIKHNQFSLLFGNIVKNNEHLVDIIFAPGNGITYESDVWLTNLHLLSNIINEHTHYELPNYKLGKIGALEGLISLYQLSSSPAIVNHFKHALVISQEQSKYQAVASYLWTSEEVHS